MLLADGGANWKIETSTDVTLDPVVEGALLEVKKRGPHSNDLEAVDESSLMLAQNSGQVNPRTQYVKAEGATDCLGQWPGQP